MSKFKVGDRVEHWQGEVVGTVTAFDSSLGNHDEYTVAWDNGVTNNGWLDGTLTPVLETRSTSSSGAEKGANLDSESVNHPAHYGGDTTYEVIKVITAWGLGFDLGNVTKYVARAGKKDPTKELEDLRKARFYLDHRINQLEQS